MKYKTIFIQFILLLMTTIHIWADEPERKVFFQLRENEEINYSEITVDFNLSQQNFACILIDTLTQEQIFVWNGERKIKASYVYCDYVDLMDYDKCIFRYRTNEGIFLKMEAETYGPYEDVFYISDFYDAYYTRYNPSFFLKGNFYFKQMNQWFRHGMDDRISVCDSGTWESDSIFNAPNGKYEGKISVDKQKVYIGNVEYIIPYQADSFLYASSPELYVFENGTGLFVQRCSTPSNPYGEDFLFLLKDKKAYRLKSNEGFNFEKQAIVPIEKNDFDYTLNPFYMYSSEKVVFDKSRKHLLMNNWEYPYVMIDNRKYGTESALEVWYDEGENAFKWIAWEGRDLALYTYKL